MSDRIAKTRERVRGLPRLYLSERGPKTAAVLQPKVVTVWSPAES
jgi:hypothetical protein